MADPHRGARFIFVGGAARSGTTLVQNILDSHPDVCGAPEFHHITDIVQLRKRLHSSVNQGLIDLICSYDDIDSCICTLIEDLLLPLAEKYKCRFLSEKTPNNVLIFPALINLFPEARFIHVVRDPRAVISSLLQVGKRAEKAGWKTEDYTHSVLAAISYVNRYLHSGFASYKISPERVLTLSYERLVSYPELETKGICRFLDIEWSQQMLCPGSIRHLGEKAVTNNVWYDTKSYNRDPESYEIDKWKAQLTYAQQVLIATAFRDNTDLVQLGYDFSPHGFLGLSLSAFVHFGTHVRRRSFALARRSRNKVRRGLRLLHNMAVLK